MTVHIFLNLQNHPTFHSEERLINVVRERECFVGLSRLLVYACRAGRRGPGVGSAGMATCPGYQTKFSKIFKTLNFPAFNCKKSET